MLPPLRRQSQLLNPEMATHSRGSAEVFAAAVVAAAAALKRNAANVPNAASVPNVPSETTVPTTALAVPMRATHNLLLPRPRADRARAVPITVRLPDINR